MLSMYRTLQPEYKYCEYLSSVKCFANRRLLSRFRCGCHGLHVDTDRWAGSTKLDRVDRKCLVCNSEAVEDEHHFLFDCPVYSPIRSKHVHLFQQVSSVSGFLNSLEANACGGFLRDCFTRRHAVLNS